MSKKIINSITVILILCLFIYSTVCTRKLNEARGLYNQYQQRYIEAERICDRVREISEKIRTTTERTVKNARDAAETVELLRVQVQELEDCCGSFSQCEYYQYWDSYYHDEQLME